MTSYKFEMVYKVDSNPQVDLCDWSMYSNILKGELYQLKYETLTSVKLDG